MKSGLLVWNIQLVGCIDCMSVVKDVMDDTHCKAKRIAYNSVVRMHDSRG